MHLFASSPLPAHRRIDRYTPTTPGLVTAALVFSSPARATRSIDIFSVNGRGFGRIEAVSSDFAGPLWCPTAWRSAQQAALTAIAPCGDFRPLPNGRQLTPAHVAELSPAVQMSWGTLALGEVPDTVAICVANALRPPTAARPSGGQPASPSVPSACAELPAAHWLPIGVVVALWATAGYIGDQLWTGWGSAAHDEERGEPPA